MKNIKYKIQFFSPWHCGSGLSGGADLDSLVIRDKNGLPFIPGKTLKGLIREAAEDYAYLCGEMTDKDIDTVFGKIYDYTDVLNKNNVEEYNGCAYFKNASLCKEESDAIISNNAQDYLFNDVSSTAISETGTAVEHSLRCIETVVPCTLYSEILNVPDEMSEPISLSLKLIHHIGVNRNRGLGRCDVNAIEKGGNK